MKFPPAPILALLALEGACALVPPGSHSGQGGDPDPITQGGAGTGGSGGANPSGGSASATTVSGGTADHGGTALTGGTLTTGGTTTTGGALATGGTPSGGSTATGGLASGGTATGGHANGGSATGGMTNGGSTAGGTTARGGSTPSGGTSARGGTTATGGMASGGSATGGTSTSPGGSYPQPPPITNGTSGFTTRYWDCCKPACGWAANSNNKPAHTCGKDGTSTVNNDTQSACGGGGGYMCYWGAPWSVSNTLSFGFAAFGDTSNCGTCFQLQFTGKGQYNANDPGSNALNGKTIIVQVINTGNISSNQFDLLLPGGGVGANNACTGGSAQWSGANIGDQTGGMLTTCKDSGSCVQQMCQAAFGSMPQLLAGCNWVAGWFAAADDPQIVYQKITCPTDITAKSGE